MIDVYVQTLNKYKVDFDSIIHPADIADSSMKPFRDKILKAMGYSNRRSDFYPDYFSLRPFENYLEPISKIIHSLSANR